jgi:nitric oxide dioxygenase
MHPNQLQTRTSTMRSSSSVEHRQAGLFESEIELVDESYFRVESRLPAMTIAFCERAFEVHPELRTLFPRGDASQRVLAASFLGFVVTNLRSEDRLCELLERMGSRGLLDGVTAFEVEDIGRSFLATLSEFEGSKWTMDTAHAWARVYMWTLAAIRRGARGRPLTQRESCGADRTTQT